MKQLRDLLYTAITITVFLGGIVALDSLTGVPLNYGVPLAAILSLLPYAFLVRRAAAVREAGRKEQDGRHIRRRQREFCRRDDERPAAVHSVLFLPHKASQSSGAFRHPGTSQNA